MLQTYLTGIVLLVLISVAWLAVQRLWQRHFPGQAEADALQGRSGCHNCSCGAGECRESTTDNTHQEAN